MKLIYIISEDGTSAHENQTSRFLNKKNQFDDK